MNQDLALKVLGQIMGWSNDRAREEFRWLKLMARLKYDGYRAFQAGMRFIESLATWLQQFKQDQRETAYSFVRHSLVYISPMEMQRLVEQLYPRTVRDRLIRVVASDCGIQPYQVFNRASDKLDRLRRQTLFMGLSEGARIDTIRHVNSGVLNNEQMVLFTQLDTEKWEDLLTRLRNDLNDCHARFRIVYLIDDFIGTGTSLLRLDDHNEWKGKLVRFMNSVESANSDLGSDRLFDDRSELCIHHYVRAFDPPAYALVDKYIEARPKIWLQTWHCSYGQSLPNYLLPNGDHADFIKLTKIYYDSIIETPHTSIGGVQHLGLGYGGRALPLVLEHNTPNNSVALLWAETDGGDRSRGHTHAMRPLFRRRQRHVVRA